MFGTQREGEVLELNDEVYYGNGDLFESCSEVSSGSEGENETLDGWSSRGMREREDGHARPGLGRPLSLPLTPRESPLSDVSDQEEIPFRWNHHGQEKDDDNEIETKTPPRRPGGSVSWIDPSPSAEDLEPTGEGDECLAKPVEEEQIRCRGRKRCLQLDLRGVADADDPQDHSVYHMGE